MKLIISKYEGTNITHVTHTLLQTHRSHCASLLPVSSEMKLTCLHVKLNRKDLLHSSIQTTLRTEASMNHAE